MQMASRGGGVWVKVPPAVERSQMNLWALALPLSSQRLLHNLDDHVHQLNAVSTQAYRVYGDPPSLKRIPNCLGQQPCEVTQKLDVILVSMSKMPAS